jgi:D-3-phosphoglycerate dehydrogenase
MKPTAYLINVARGGIVDETALYNALKENVIAGAALDVFAEEPTTDSPIFGLPNVVVTPHLGASTAEAQDRAGITAAEQVATALRGAVPMHAINAPVPVGEGAEFVAQFSGLCESLGSLLYQLTDRPGRHLEDRVQGRGRQLRHAPVGRLGPEGPARADGLRAAELREHPDPGKRARPQGRDLALLGEP